MRRGARGAKPFIFVDTLQNNLTLYSSRYKYVFREALLLNHYSPLKNLTLVVFRGNGVLEYDCSKLMCSFFFRKNVLVILFL